MHNVMRNGSTINAAASLKNELVMDVRKSSFLRLADFQYKLIIRNNHKRIDNQEMTTTFNYNFEIPNPFPSKQDKHL